MFLEVQPYVLCVYVQVWFFMVVLVVLIGNSSF